MNISVRFAVGTLLCVLFFMDFTPETQAVCCHNAGGDDCDGKYCGDCSRKTSYSCCSFGSCNLFCCNCDDECLKPPVGMKHFCQKKWIIPLVYKKITCDFVDARRKRSPDQSNSFTIEKFNKIDLDDDLKISHDEMKAHFGNEMHDQHLSNEFHKMDQDQSGFIEAQEFDGDISEEML